MARKDKVFESFLKHKVLRENYNLTEDELSIKQRQSLTSDIPIIKAIGLIVDALEKQNRDSDKAIDKLIRQHLNTTV